MMNRLAVVVIMGMLLVLCGFTAIPDVQTQPGLLHVAGPVQVTFDTHYERGQSLTYDGTAIWLFYGRSDTVTGNYQNDTPDIHDYRVYYKKAPSIGGLPAATPTMVIGAHNQNSYLGETGSAFFQNEVWVFATIDVGATCSLYGWWTNNGGTTWNEVGPIITGLSDGQAHHDEIVFNGEVWVVEGSGNFNTMHSATPKNVASFSAPLQVGTLTGGLAHFSILSSSLYLAITSAHVTYIYGYDPVNGQWNLVDSLSTPRTYDPTLCRVGTTYLLVEAPMPSDWSYQWLEGYSNPSLKTLLTNGTNFSVTTATFGTNTWIDMWPIAYPASGTTVYLFFTSERNPANLGSEITGNIWYFLMRAAVPYTERPPTFGSPLCPLARNNVNSATMQLESVQQLYQQVLGLDYDAARARELIEEAEQLLEKARAFCLNSQNCIAGNTLALEAQQLLKEAQEMLESMLS